MCLKLRKQNLEERERKKKFSPPRVSRSSLLLLLLLLVLILLLRLSSFPSTTTTTSSLRNDRVSAHFAHYICFLLSCLQSPHLKRCLHFFFLQLSAAHFSCPRGWLRVAPPGRPRPMARRGRPACPARARLLSALSPSQPPDSNPLLFSFFFLYFFFPPSSFFFLPVIFC